MKQFSKTISTLVTGMVLLLGLTISSCKKAEAGPAGKNGQDGNANVQSTGEIDLGSLTWAYQSAGDAYVTIYPMAAVTQDVVDKGLVMAYIKTTDGWAALPFSAVMYDTDNITFEVMNGAVRFYYRGNDESTTTVDPSITTLIVRIVIVPAMIKKPNVDHYDYEEVKEAYQL
jgi:hypothetical protein